MRLAEPYYSRVLALCAELRSGQWFQIDAKLRVNGSFYDGDGHWRADTPRFCCLGVACELSLRHGVGHRIEERYWDRPELFNVREGETSTLPGSIMDWYGFDDPNPSIIILCGDISDGKPGAWCHDCRANWNSRQACTNTIEVPATEANDDLGLNFAQIADGFARRWLGGVDATPES